MNADEQLRRLRQTPLPTPEEKKRKMVSSILLTLATLLSVLFLVYAFMQKLEADAQREKAVVAQQQAEESFAEAERQRQIALEEKEKAEIAKLEAERQQAIAQQALDDCKKTKR